MTQKLEIAVKWKRVYPNTPFILDSNGSFIGRKTDAQKLKEMAVVPQAVIPPIEASFTPTITSVPAEPKVADVQNALRDAMKSLIGVEATVAAQTVKKVLMDASGGKEKVGDLAPEDYPKVIQACIDFYTEQQGDKK